MTRDLNTNSISVKHIEGDLNKGYLYISEKARNGHNNTREYTIKLREDFLTPLERNHYLIVSNLPFTFNKADMTFNYYINKDGNIISTIYNTSVDGLIINIYGRSCFREDDE